MCRHPLIDICDTVFKFLNISRRIIATTTLIQLRIVSKSVIVDAVLISLLVALEWPAITLIWPLSQSCRASPDWPMLPATRHSWTCTNLTLTRHASTQFSYPWRMNGWVDLKISPLFEFPKLSAQRGSVVLKCRLSCLYYSTVTYTDSDSSRCMQLPPNSYWLALGHPTLTKNVIKICW